jgi:ABC-type Mn2+/Zn2+ transport system ATPase subunit
MGIIPRMATPLVKSVRTQSEHDDPSHAAAPARRAVISFDGVSVDRGRTTVLQVERLEIDSGYTALVGPNGSGKSTMLHVIAGLLAPSAGSVTFHRDRSGTGRRVAYVLQSQHASEQLLVTAREVVQLARPARRLTGLTRRADRRVVDDVMARLDVGDLANRHLAEMSGGQRQRVFIAQGLAQDADVLLLDEPVAGLDLASEQTIRCAIEDERSSGHTVVVATHDLEEAARADHVVMLNGSVIAVGRPDEVLRADNLRRAYRGRVLDFGDGTVAVDDDHHH